LARKRANLVLGSESTSPSAVSAEKTLRGAWPSFSFSGDFTIHVGYPTGQMALLGTFMPYPHSGATKVVPPNCDQSAQAVPIWKFCRFVICFFFGEPSNTRCFQPWRYRFKRRPLGISVAKQKRKNYFHTPRRTGLWRTWRTPTSILASFIWR